MRVSVPAHGAAAGAALLLATLASGCESIPDDSRPSPAPAYAWADVEHPTSAAEVAKELGMKSHVDAALRALVLEGEGGRVVFVDGTRTIMVAGRRLEAGEVLSQRGTDLPLRAEDAAAVKRTWREAMAEQRSKEPEGKGAPSASTPRGPVRNPSAAGGDAAWRVPLKRTWKGILVHHSATEAGNMALLDKHHKEANGWLGIGYDFLIDNGNGAADGLVETTFRWKQQIQGAHAGPGLHEYNDHWIGVCLVGNFNDGRPTRAQMKSLVRLVRFLQEYCGIPEENIRVHRDIRDTECPGRKFPLQELRRDFPRAK